MESKIKKERLPQTETLGLADHERDVADKLYVFLKHRNTLLDTGAATEGDLSKAIGAIDVLKSLLGGWGKEAAIKAIEEIVVQEDSRYLRQKNN